MVIRQPLNNRIFIITGHYLQFDGLFSFFYVTIFMVILVGKRLTGWKTEIRSRDSVCPYGSGILCS